jgi:hypothetical protein
VTRQRKNGVIMNLHIKRTQELKINSTVSVYVLRLLLDRRGIVCALLFLDLFLSETYYQNQIHKAANTIDIGGPATIIGLVLFIRLILITNKGWGNYYHQLKLDSTQELYADLTDEHIETGIYGMSFQRHTWKSLLAVVEKPGLFKLKTRYAEIKIYKSDINDQSKEQEIRLFLLEKLLSAKNSAVPGGTLS